MKKKKTQIKKKMQIEKENANKTNTYLKQTRKQKSTTQTNKTNKLERRK